MRSGEGKDDPTCYSLAEPHEKLMRQAKIRQELQRSLDIELRQLLRTASYADRIKSIQNLSSLMTQSNEYNTPQISDR